MGPPWKHHPPRQLRRLRLVEMRTQVAAGLASLDRGEGVSGEEVFDELEAGIGEQPDAGR